MTPSLPQLITKGASATRQLKRSTGEQRETLQTPGAFANGKGGRVAIGVKPSGEIVGQQVSEQTFHEITAARDRFELPTEFEIERLEIGPGRSALVLTVAGALGFGSNAERGVLPNLDVFAAAVSQGFADLVHAAPSSRPETR